MTPSKPLPKISAKRRKQTPARRACVAQVRERSGGRCQIYPVLAFAHVYHQISDSERGVIENYYWRCTRRETEVHELQKRSRGGSITDPDNCIDSCHSCHRFTEEHPALAQRLGLLLSGHRPISQVRGEA